MKLLNGKDFKEMLSSGAANLDNNQAEINALNVFPVPDGDTGTNMSMTFNSGAKEANQCFSNNIGDVAKSLSKGLLMGARGNSGVITSQIFRGFAQSIEGKEEINTKELAEAFENGTRVAYKAIMKPVEGTILTVIREASWYANREVKENPKMDIETYFHRLEYFMEDSLEHTPDLLPILKEANVVDSGGAGLLKIVQGFIAYIDGTPVTTNAVVVELARNAQSVFENEEFGYCTEFILRLKENYLKGFDENVLKNKLAKEGESLVFVRDEDLIKVHIHTLHPGDALNLAQRYGEFVKIKVENMQEQHSELVKEGEVKPKEKKAIGVIAVAAGDGVTNLMYELGVDCVISGGQTMNPSTSDFIEKIKELDHCEKIMIFPNNSNIMLAAKQAKDLVDYKEVEVIECKSIQACLSALARFSPESDFNELVAEFNELCPSIKTASVTYAVKDSSIDGIELKEGDYMAMIGKSIVTNGTDLSEVCRLMLEKFLDEDSELLTLITGEDADEEITERIVEYVENNSDIEVDVIKGDVPVYYYLMGLE
ncbi:MAG: DAK2 domain-containing protein [Solobacterium sp.]|nr:DAK2 domain-containing protein [Solobacterium sp.]MDY2953536.1 DAK2 domain-containing protein [Erysipelotrichaceae bacterium]MCI6696146.1 DAK2 domain-containing protein [Solobacterium sp.]MCI6846840.1 DAK2 domain-containing protein [Solobacterium sp.]MCI6877442.1 DAK2 domain-containing protein [Solobacterium sp.]